MNKRLIGIALAGLMVASLAASSLARSAGALGGEPVSFYRLRFELSTTARGAQITAQETEGFLTVRYVGVQGDPDRHGVNMHSLWVGREAAGPNVALIADYALAPEALDEPILYLFEQTAEGSSSLRVFNVVGEETELVAEIRHSGAEPLEFSLDLSGLQGMPPLQETLPTVEPSPMLWAYYYMWYTMSDWESEWLQDWPVTPYRSNDRGPFSGTSSRPRTPGLTGSSLLGGDPAATRIKTWPLCWTSPGGKGSPS